MTQEILLQNILTFSFITLVHFWYEILRKSCESLAAELSKEVRDKLCEDAIDKAKYFCKKWDINATIRVRRRRKMPRVLAWLKMSLERCLQEVTFLALLKALFIVSNKEYVHDLDDQVTFISNLNKI